MNTANPLYLNLLKKIENKSARITVIGLGYVGLPTALVLANVGYSVVGLDINNKIVNTVKDGKSPTNEPGLDELISNLIKDGRFNATTEYNKALENADIVIYIVNTPLDKTSKKANLTSLKQAIEMSSPYIRKGMLLIVGSTVPPKTTDAVVKKMIEERTNLKVGSDFWLAYCPERIAPGKAIKELTENDRLVGGVDEKSTELAYRLLKHMTKGTIIRTTALTAEISKLAENTFRDINIAFANELALISEELGADVMEVIRCANTHPRVNIHRPGNGVGGPCLTKDPYFLINSIEQKNLPADLIISSRKINDFMPAHVVSILEETLSEHNIKLENATIAVFGLTYKGDVDDLRESPALKIVELLRERGVQLKLMDPYITEIYDQKVYSNAVDVARGADAIIIATDHSLFRNLNFKQIIKVMKHPIILDSKRILRVGDIKLLGIVYKGIGYTTE